MILNCPIFVGSVDDFGKRYERNKDLFLIIGHRAMTQSCLKLNAPPEIQMERILLCIFTEDRANKVKKCYKSPVLPNILFFI